MYLKAHEDHVALQRLRRNKALTPDDLVALEQMLLESGAAATAARSPKPERKRTASGCSSGRWWAWIGKRR